MQLKDLKIGKQLHLGLGIILFFAVLLAAAAWMKTNLQWQQTKGLYEHPHQVRRAIGALEADILAIRSGMKDLTMVQNIQELESVLQELEVRQADAEQQFRVLYDRYLGPRSDITVLHDDFIKWNSIRKETIRLCREGKMAEARARIHSSGVGGAQAEVLTGHLRTIDNFARNKSDEFYRNALRQHGTLRRQLAAFITVILTLSLLVVWLLRKGIKTPLAELTSVTDQFRQGRLDARSRHVSANEFGDLSAAFNAMADTIQTQMQISANEAQIAAVMLRENDIRAFCKRPVKI